MSIHARKADIGECKRDGEMYIENWVFVDMTNLFGQLGVALFERLAQEAGSIQPEMR